MFDALAAAIRELDVPLDDRSMRTLVALFDKLAAKTHLAVGEFDDARLWELTGATSMRAWLRDEGLCGPDATRMERIAKRLTRLPVLADHWRRGLVSSGHVRVVMEHLTNHNEALFAEHEAALVPVLVGLTVTETNAVMNEWRARADATLDPAGQPEPDRTLCHSQTLGGRFVTNGAYDPEGGAIIAAALAVADTGDLDTDAARRRADALVEVCNFFLDHHDKKLTPRQRPHVSLIINADDLANGQPQGTWSEHDLRVDGLTTQMYLCDCSIHPATAQKIANRGYRILNLGRSTETVNAAQRKALTIRDRHCRYPGCDRPAAWTDAHHIWWWSRGGPTDLDNLVLLCRRHHRWLHKKDFQAKLLPDGTLEITDNYGITRTSRPPGSQPLLI